MEMKSKSEILTQLRGELARWEDVLSSLSAAQITAPAFIGDYSIKDVLAHLMAWQTRSVARLQAARAGRAPVYPDWPVQPAPDPLDNSDEINAWINATYRDRPWADVHRGWSGVYRSLLELAEAIPEKDLLDPAKYAWMEGQPLMAVLQGTYEHHHDDHLKPLLARLYPDSHS